MAYLREIESDIIGQAINGSTAVAKLFADLQDETKEKFIVINLDTKNKILCYEVVAIGNLNSIQMRPMEVSRTSILVNAASAIVMHNHTSGDPLPSSADVEFTRKLYRIAKDLGLKMLDHLIIGIDRYYSFTDEGLMSQIIAEEN